MIQIESPSLSIFEFDHCMLVGGVDFVFVGDMAVHHDLFVPSVHNCPAENLGLISMKRKENALSLNVSRPPSTLETGISLIGQCSGNYAHWLTETLPKLAVLNVFREYENVPLLVDDGLHPNMYESIQFINENRREVIRVKYGEPVLINRLVTTSAPSYERYVPHGVDSHEAEPYINRFSRPALCKLRSSVSSGMLDTAYAVSKRIYLARGRKSGNIRQITNASEIEATVLANGFRCVDPEAMTFKDQASACIGAEAIVAPVGASLANMIFAPPGCKIIVLAPYYGEASYFYYSNLAGVLGHEVHYILGKQTKCRRHPIHRDYYVDPEVLACALRTVVGA
jgi:capsular polysaccharide biosynthesis protein